MNGKEALRLYKFNVVIPEFPFKYIQNLPICKSLSLGDDEKHLVEIETKSVTAPTPTHVLLFAIHRFTQQWQQFFHKISVSIDNNECKQMCQEYTNAM